MSFQAVSWVFKTQTQLDVESKMILLVIANYTDPFGLSWPSQLTISEMAGVSKSTFWRRIEEMKGAKIIGTINRRGGSRQKSNAYLLPDHPLALVEEFEESYGSAFMDFADYVTVYHSIRQSLRQRLSDEPSESQAETRQSLRQRHISYHPNLLDQPPLPGRAGTIIDASNGATSMNGFVNQEIEQQFDELLTWLQNRKKIRNLAPQTWYQLFIDIATAGIPVSDFKNYYLWLEGQDWVKFAINEKMIRNQVENYINREKFESKTKEKNGKSKRSTAATLLADLQRKNSGGGA